MSEHRFHSKEMFLQTIDKRDWKLIVDIAVLGNDDQPEVGMNQTLDSVSSKAQINVTVAAHGRVILK